MAVIVYVALALRFPQPARAQTDDYPSRTVTFICPFPAGGGTDILVRLLAAELQDKLKRPVIVDNRVGAGTVIAASAVAKSPPDGYTLFLAPVTTLAIGPPSTRSCPTTRSRTSRRSVSSARRSSRSSPTRTSARRRCRT